MDLLRDLIPWGPLIQPAVTVFGFTLVIIQLLFLSRNLQGSAQHSLYAHYSEICKLFLDKAYLRPYFYDNEPRPDSDPSSNPLLRNEIDAMSEAILGLIEHAVVQQQNLPPDSWENCWRRYAAERVRNGPPVRQFYEQHRDYYAKALQTQIELILADAAKRTA